MWGEVRVLWVGARHTVPFLRDENLQSNPGGLFFNSANGLHITWGSFDLPQTPGILIRLAGLEASEIIRF
jgi:hypothetical protein